MLSYYQIREGSEKMSGYQDYEIDAYFGEFADEYRQTAIEMIENYGFDTLVNLMDDEIREELHFEISPCDDLAFLMWYLVKHTEKFGDDFKIL